MIKLSEQKGNTLHGILLIALFSCAAFYIAEIPFVRSLSFSPLIVGIILGIGYITIGGEGFSGFTIESIETLMGGVAVAMIASFVGIFFTTRSSWCSKTESRKIRWSRIQSTA